MLSRIGYRPARPCLITPTPGWPHKTPASPRWNLAGSSMWMAMARAVPPMAPAKLTGSLWLIGGQPNCDNFSNSDQNTAASFVEDLKPAGAGTTTGMLGYMFWAAGCQGNGTGCTFPPNTCQNGMGGAMTAFNVPVPMPALRQN